MSILGAAAVGATLGKSITGVIVNYDKAQYLAKITELEGYYSLLSTHLDRMEELKSQIYDFWDDEEAQIAGETLRAQIKYVRGTMDNAAILLNSFRTTVAGMDTAKTLAGGELEAGLSALASLK